MSIFDMALQTTGLQSAATAVATSLAPKHHGTTTQSPVGISSSAVKAHASAGSTDSSSSTEGATISSSDFLTLLVTELQNQDPTQPTDPNAYIQQLVGVNSLQQLIQINQGISSIDSGTQTTTGHIVSAPSSQV